VKERTARRRAGSPGTARTEPAATLAPAWLGAALAALALFALVYGWREIFSPDIGFYLATGREIVEAGAIPHLDTLTWTRADAPYPNLWWLYQVLSWLAWSAAGGLPLVAGHVLVTLASLALVMVRTRERWGFMPAAASGLLLLFILGNAWELRPHVASWLYLSSILWILERDARGQAGRWLWLLPAIFVLWINTHALYALGFVALGAHAIDRLLDPQRRRERRLWLVGAASLVACLANPLFADGLLLPFEQLRILQASVFASGEVGIAEYRGLFDFSGFRDGEHLVLWRPHLFALLYLAAAVLGALGAARRLRRAEALLLLGFGYLLVTAVRNFGFFFLVSFPIVAGGLGTLARRVAARSADALPKLATAWHGSVALLALLLIGLTLDGRPFAWEWLPHRLGTSFNRSLLPVELCRFMVEHGIEGRVLNSWDDGGYVAFATRQKTFIDGRMEVMGDAHFRAYLALKDPATIQAGLRHFAPDVAIVPHNRIPLWLFTFSRQLHWRMVYADESWALFLRPGLAPELGEVELAHPVRGRDYPAYTREEIQRRLEAEAAKPPAGLREAWLGRDAFPLAAVRRSGFFFQLGEYDAAAAVGLAAMEETPFAVPDLALNAGYALLEAGDLANAERSFALFVRGSRVPEDVAQVEALRTRLSRGRDPRGG
jgi:hypothetical protein